MSMRRFSDLDALFLAGETPSQHLHVLATLVLDASAVPAGERFRLVQEVVRTRFHRVEPMRRRLQDVPFGAPVWVDDAEINLGRHLRHVVLTDGGSLDDLARLAGEVASRPLVRGQPLWEVWCVEGMDDDQLGVIAKIHHCAVDGVSGIGVLAAFFDLEPDAPIIAGDGWTPGPRPTSVDVLREAVADAGRRPAAVLRSLGRVLGAGMEMARTRTPDAPLPFAAPRLRLNGALTPRRSVAFTRLPLDRIKGIRRTTGATVNDVLVAVLSGALRAYLRDHGELPERALVAAVPVSERGEGEDLVGNRLSFMLYALPVHLADPMDRLRGVQRSATAAKDLYDRVGVGLFADIASLAPPAAVGPIVRGLSRFRVADAIPPFANVTVSNIRGPDIPLYVAGARLTDMFPMGPLLEGVGLGLTVVSYRDDVDLGFIACPDLMPDVDRLANKVHDEVDELASSAEA